MEPKKPNVVFVITDDQGYGDLGCTGNPWIKTPNIDRFYQEAARLTDFHVEPLCTPTRGALMTGHRPIRNGAWATCWGRSILRADETTLADLFRANGYRTGMFGKWHLGDNYPYRPFDRGFEHVVAHKGGGVGQTPDFWGNNYFDDTYFHNGQARAHNGYCTDIWFDEGMKFIEAHKAEPFFAWIATNAPHDPYLVAEKYASPYRNNPDIVSPEFYGMITNIDENFGRLDAFLARHGLCENTILIFMTDNGSSGGVVLDSDKCVTRGYNAGMRGKKGDYYDGGHRVPFFVRWPEHGIGGGCDIDGMCLDIDVFPTLAELCGLRPPKPVMSDGVSFAGLLDDPLASLPERTHFLQIRQSTTPPEQWENCVMTREWRLVFGRELYRIKDDPGQMHDLAAEYPEVVNRLRAIHTAWWKEMKPGFSDVCALSLGNDAENPTCLCAMDVMGDVAWNQGQILNAMRSTGRWRVNVERPGLYRFELRRWPRELPIPMDATVSKEFPKTAIFPNAERVCIHPEKVRFKLFGDEYFASVEPDSERVLFELDLRKTGKTDLDAWFIDADGEERGAYYVYVTRIEE